MATYLIMGKFTDQGIKNIKKTIDRSEKFEETAKEFGVQIREIMWVMGDFDVFAIAEGKDDQSVCALLLKTGAWGNVHSTTFRAFPKSEMESVVGKID